MKRTRVIGGLFALLLALTIGGYFAWRWKSSQTKPEAPPPQSVATAEVSLAATLRAKSMVEVGVPIAGKIEVFHVEVGADVYQGQLLAQVRSESVEGIKEAASIDLETAKTKISNLETLIASARLEASRASADASRANSELERTAKAVERQRILLAEGATPKLEYEKARKEHIEAEAAVKGLDAVALQAETRASNIQRDLDASRKTQEAKAAELEHADAQLASGDIYSPVDGVVASRRGQPGDDVNQGMKDLFQIATELSSMEAIADANPKQAALVRPGQQAFVIVAEAPGEMLPGIVKGLDDGRVTVDFQNLNPLIRPGLSAQVRIQIGSPQTR